MSLSQYLVRTPVSLTMIEWDQDVQTLKAPREGYYKDTERPLSCQDFIAQEGMVLCRASNPSFSCWSKWSPTLMGLSADRAEVIKLAEDIVRTQNAELEQMGTGIAYRLNMVSRQEVGRW